MVRDAEAMLMNTSQERILLGAILVLYLVLGSLFAIKTPLWQVPDEPAHYNYVRYVAEQRALPELVEGDYPAEWLAIIKSFKFTGMSIDRIKYEGHQPPLYYVLAALIYAAATAAGLQAPLVLRFFSLLIGALALYSGYRVVRHVLPHEPELALGTGAFLATLPMHLTMTMGINNDVLAELILALVALAVLARPALSWRWTKVVFLGVLLGLAFLTKLQAYVALVIIVAALLWEVVTSRRQAECLLLGRAAGMLAVILGVALLVCLPWLIRNGQVYGWSDLLAQNRHAQVVAGQLTTAQHIARIGMTEYLKSAVMTTFQSFWGQFGWMGVVLHPRFYLGAALVSALALVGLLLYAVRLRRDGQPLVAQTRRGYFVLAAWFLASLAGFLWYNTQFVQFQGRYLFPAIVPIGLAFTIGMRELFRRKPWVPLAAIGILVAFLLVDGLCGRNLKVFSTLMTAAAAPIVLVGNLVERFMPGLMLVPVYLGMAAYSLVCLFNYIVPQLTP